jgi:hypothetical protein
VQQGPRDQGLVAGGWQSVEMLTDGLETQAVPMHTAAIGVRRGGRVVEGAPLLREYTSKAYRGFESLPLRHLLCNRLEFWDDYGIESLSTEGDD